MASEAGPRARVEAVLLPALVAIAGLTVWSLAVKWSGTTVFPSPRAVLDGFLELKQRGVAFAYARDSLFRVLTGFLFAAALGVPLGLFLGRSRTALELANPLIQLLRPVSPLAWIPLSIVLLGIGDRAAELLIFLGAFFPILLSAASAAQAVPEVYLRAGENFGLSRAEMFRRVVLPAALPQILLGLRVALGIGWLVVVAAEMIAIDSGLGYLIIDARNAGKRYDLVVAGILLIGAIGLALDVAMRQLERLRPVRWGFRR